MVSGPYQYSHKKYRKPNQINIRKKLPQSEIHQYSKNYSNLTKINTDTDLPHCYYA